MAMHSAAFRASHFVYDSLSMSRAHCRLPMLRRPFLVWIHGIEVWEGTNPALIKRSRCADVLVSNSRYTRERAEQCAGGFARARICWLATETDEPPSYSPRGDVRPRVSIVARMDGGRYKGHAELIQAWPAVVSAVPDAVLTIIGQGPSTEHYKALAAKTCCKSNIEFRGFVPDSCMEQVWAETSVFAMPSRGEGFGIVYIEAMRHSVPVLASIHDAASEINVDGVTGYNVSLDKPGELTERLLHLLRNPDHAAQLGRNGHLRWQEHFRYSSFRDRLVPIVRDFLR
jgi:phosphatidylinositol alpha-1,6-mannosyltransferase